MIEKALRFITKMAEPIVLEFDGRKYTSKEIEPVMEPRIGTLKVDNLESIVSYIKKLNETGSLYVIHIEDFNHVSLRTEIFGEWKEREHILDAECERQEFRFGRFMDAEEFIINLQTNFLETEDLKAIQTLVGNLRDETVRSLGDDGISQQVTIRTGIASVGDAKVPNPVKLKPYRTFREIEQPESLFVFRMKEGGLCALFEADGGLWKTAAREGIKKYFEFELEKQIAENRVIIL